MRASLSRPALIAALLCCGLAACSSGEQVVDTSSPEPTSADASSSPDVPFPTAGPAQAPSTAAAPEIVTVPQPGVPAQPNPAAASKREEAKPVDSAAGQDYYTKRASETLKADANVAAGKPHPLAAAHPDYFVTVCEAGCTDDHAPEIAAMERKVTQQTVTQGMMVPTSTGGAADTGASQDRSILCIGGCFDMPKSFPARAVPQTVSSAAKSAARAPAKRDPLSPVR